MMALPWRRQTVDQLSLRRAVPQKLQPLQQHSCFALVDFKDQPKTSKTVIDSGGRAKTTVQYLFQRLCPFGKNSAKL